jgi:hypothetical protein
LGANAERFENEVHLEEDSEEHVQVQEEASNFRFRKHHQVENKLYIGFWRHNDNKASDEDI